MAKKYQRYFVRKNKTSGLWVVFDSKKDAEKASFKTAVKARKQARKLNAKIAARKLKKSTRLV